MFEIWKQLNMKRVVIILLLVLFEASMFLYLPTLASDVLNLAGTTSDTSVVWSYGWVMLFLNTVSLGLSFFNVRMSAQESQGLGNRLRKQFFEKVMKFSQKDYTEFGTSTLITRTTNDIMVIQLVTMMVLRLIIISPTIMLVSFVLAFRRQAELAWIFGLTLPTFVLIIGIIIYKANPIFRSIQGKTDRLNKVFREGLTGIRVIRAFNTTEYEEERFDEANTDFRDTSIRANSILALMLPSSFVILGVSNYLNYTYGAKLISQGVMSVGNLVAFSQYGFQILNSVLQIAFLLYFLPRAEVAAERINEVINYEPSIVDHDEVVVFDRNQPVTLEFENVAFGFPNAERPAVFDINFKAEAGDTIAIIGGTGSGKTTIANLVPRLYEAVEGRVLINGHEVSHYSQEDLRNQIGFAPQQALLFSGTIRSNLQFGNPDATDEEMWEAIDIAQGEFVHELEDGLDSRVEQGGRNFSGGQRQRLSIARAIIGKTPIYIFDDSFSALDFKTDANLRKALRPWTRESISLIIAQRVNTVIDADRILVLDNGEIVGMGTHEELVKTNDVYRDIVDSQMKGEEV